jgi:hypothetical protein
MTECTQDSFEFEAHFSRQVTAKFDAGTLTTDGGGLLLRQTERRIGMLKRLAGCFTDWRRADRVEHQLDQMLAQRIYAGQRSGTAATATARAALVDAAAAVARHAGGGLTRQAAIAAVNAALERIRALRGHAVSRIPTDEQDRHVAFLPLASAGELDGLRARREADR